MSASTRWLLGIAVVLVLASGASVAVALLAGGEQQFAEGTPERAVQQYLAAVADGDEAEALTYLTASLAERCRNTAGERVLWGSYRVRATLDDSTMRDGSADVRVRITEVYGGLPFDRSESTWTETFSLVQEGGEWLIGAQPWPLYCGR